MLMKVTVQPTNVQKSDKAEKLGAAVQQMFQQHQAQLGSKTLMSIAYCCAAVRP